MGIKNLNKFIKDKFPESMINIHLSSLAYKKVAIDISLYLFKYKAVCGDNWLSAFINLVASLRRNDIHCVFIYDGQSPPEKEHEKQKRREEKEKLIYNVFLLQQALDNYYKTNIIDKILIDLYNRRRSPSNHKSLLQSASNSVDIQWIEEKIKQKEQQIIDIDPSDFEFTKNLFDILKVPYLVAPWEAEKLCSKLCLDNVVDAVLSEDTDVIAYGAPIFLSKIDTLNDTVTVIENKILLDYLNFSKEQLLDLCIMSGTDYNDNIPKVGNATAYKYLDKYKCIEKIPNIDTSILKFERSRELFTTFPDHDIIKTIPYCGHPDWELLKNFITTHKIDLDIPKLQKNFFREIIFEDI